MPASPGPPARQRAEPGPEAPPFSTPRERRPRSAHLDDDLAPRPPLPDVGQGRGDVVETERAVDPDADLSGETALGQRGERGRPLPPDEDTPPPPREPADQRADRE